MRTFTHASRAGLIAPPTGATAVEFALIASVFFMMLIGVMEVGRTLWIWNAASEATRHGARLAVVCDIGDSDVKKRMRELLPVLKDSDITVAYLPSGCDANNCEAVTVTLASVKVQTAIPFTSFAPKLPPFRTTLSRESMASISPAPASVSNPVCM